MNYPATQIKHIYTQVKKEQTEALSKVNLVGFTHSFGHFCFKTNEVFQLNGESNLKYKNVGYGDVRFFGNISGKVPTQGLFYKSKEIQKQIESLIRIMDTINEGRDKTVRYVMDQHGTPTPQHAILWQIA